MTNEDDFRLRAKARKTTDRTAVVNTPASYKGFFQEARIALVRGKAVSGRRAPYVRQPIFSFREILISLFWRFLAILM